MFGDVRVATAKLMLDAGVITADEYDRVRVEAEKEFWEHSRRLNERNRVAREQFEALPSWRRWMMVLWYGDGAAYVRAKR